MFISCPLTFDITNYEDYQNEDGSIDLIKLKLDYIKKKPYWDENNYEYLPESNDDFYLILNNYNVSEKIVSDNFFHFNNSIMEFQLLSDGMVVLYRKYIKWDIYLKYNLLSNELLDKIYDNIPDNILLHNIDYKNKKLIYNSKYNKFRDF